MRAIGVADFVFIELERKGSLVTRRFPWKSAAAALLAAAAIFGSAALASAFSPQEAPFGASTIGRGIAGQHNHFAAGAPKSHRHHYGDAPYGASTMGRGIAGFHSRHGY